MIQMIERNFMIISNYTPRSLSVSHITPIHIVIIVSKLAALFRALLAHMLAGRWFEIAVHIGRAQQDIK